MLHAPTMAAKKPVKTAPAKPAKGATKTPEKAAEGRRKSLLVQAGEETMRALLLKTLKANGWSVTATSDALEMGGSANVLRAIRTLGLDEEYDAARERGDVRPGPKPK